MTEKDGMTFRQYLAAIGLSVFSPLSRRLPEAVLERAGFSGWLAPLVALPLLLGAAALLRRLTTAEGRAIGLGESLERRLGRVPGKVITVLLVLWLVFYGGSVLRSGGERIISTVYPTASLSIFLPLLLILSLVFALGKLRWAGRSALVLRLFFVPTLLLALLLALPSVKGAYVWPPSLRSPGRLLLAGLPVMETTAPWVCFSFLRGRVEEDEKSLPRAFRGIFLLSLLTLLLLLAVIGDMGPELAGRQQFPFFVMVKNLRLFNLMERFDALIVGLWMTTDFVFVGMLLTSASLALQGVCGSRGRKGWVILCAAGMLGTAVFVSRDAFAFYHVSEKLVPAVNLGIVFLLLPLAALFPLKKKSEKSGK